MTISIVMGQFLYLSSLCVLGLALSKASKIDMTLCALLAGVAGGFLIPVIDMDTGIRASNIQGLVFYIILPVLIFDAAWHLNPTFLKRWLSPIFLLATLGVVMGCGIIGAITFYAIGHDTGFPWIAALLTGAILSATDPVAVIASLKKLNAPEELAAIIEGESLFNDATAVVLFTIILGLATSAQQSQESNYILFFLSVFLGGCLIGSLCAFIATRITLFISNESSSHIILILLAFSSFYIAEHVFHVSGIMSVMTAAIFSRLLLSKHQSTQLKTIKYTWDWLGTYFIAFIFVLMGLTIVFSMFYDHWLSMIIAIFASLAARAIVVFGIGATTNLHLRKIPLAWQIVMYWGGLKGAIAIALVLSIPVSLPYWWTIQSMVFGVVLFSLLIQGTTINHLINRAKVVDPI